MATRTTMLLTRTNASQTNLPSANVVTVTPIKSKATIETPISDLIMITTVVAVRAAVNSMDNSMAAINGSLLMASRTTIGRTMVASNSSNNSMEEGTANNSRFTTHKLTTGSTLKDNLNNSSTTATSSSSTTDLNNPAKAEATRTDKRLTSRTWTNLFTTFTSINTVRVSPLQVKANHLPNNSNSSRTGRCQVSVATRRRMAHSNSSKTKMTMGTNSKTALTASEAASELFLPPNIGSRRS